MHEAPPPLTSAPSPGASAQCWRTWSWLGRSAWETLASGARGLGELVYPWRCALCEAVSSDGPFCSDCRVDLIQASTEYAAIACPRCGIPAGPFADLQGGCGDCRRKRMSVEAVTALGTYEGALRDLCLSLKHDQSAWLAPRLGTLFAEIRLTDQSGKASGTKLFPPLPPDTWVVPIPLHWRRRWDRGYNQAEALASGIGRKLGLRVRQPLRRVVDTVSLAGSRMSATERVAIMRGVFRARSTRGLQGRVVLLVDDILTTGATVGEAARVLKKAGAARVVCAVLARAEGKRSS